MSAVIDDLHRRIISRRLDAAIRLATRYLGPQSPATLPDIFTVLLYRNIYTHCLPGEIILTTTRGLGQGVRLSECVILDREPI